MAQFFINRPIFAWVIAIVIMLGGALSIFTLPLEQYPDIAPPRVTIGAQYTGASAETVENSVTQIIEQQLKGIDNMLYMSSTSDASGRARTTLTFAPGTNIDVAQVQVQNKLQSAVNRLPDAVKSRGVFVNKGGQDFLVTYSFFSKDPAMTAVDIGDYLTSNLVDVIGRLDGVGDVNVFGTNYAMRIWMDPAKMEKYALMPSDLVNALNSQNAQVSAGQLGALPAVSDQQLNATITARTKLKTVEQFEDIVLKSSLDGSVVLMKDVARVELGADNLTIKAKLNGLPGAGMGIVLADGANAMQVADTIAAKLAELKPFFPNEIDYFVSSDSTPFVRASIKEVVSALGEAMILVVIVMFIFLQNFRATMIPAIAVPVVLLGTFGVLSLAGYSINTLTMFAMVLAIGLLVDDAIVVVENVERVMHETGMSPKQATRQSMREITPALVGIGVTLSAVFVPMAFFGGSTGVIYRQFSITIVAAMALSVFVALTLTPALCATLLKPPAGGGAGHDRPIRSGILGVNDRFFRWFNHHFDATAARYQGTVAYSLRRAKRMMLIFLAVCGVVWLLMARLPTSFLPDEDQGFVFVNINLPSGAADARLQGVLDEVRDYFAKQPDVGELLPGLGPERRPGLGTRLRAAEDLGGAAAARPVGLRDRAPRDQRPVRHPRCARAGRAAAGRARPGLQLGFQLHDQGHERPGPPGAAGGQGEIPDRGPQAPRAHQSAHDQPGRRQRAAPGHRRPQGRRAGPVVHRHQQRAVQRHGRHLCQRLPEQRARQARLHPGRCAAPHAAPGHRQMDGAQRQGRDGAFQFVLQQLLGLRLAPAHALQRQPGLRNGRPRRLRRQLGARPCRSWRTSCEPCRPA